MTENIKLVVVGDGATGKTCLLISYANNSFPTDYVPTVFDNYNATVLYENKHVSIDLWDTAGLPDYDRLRPLSYPETNGSLRSVESKWYPEICERAPGVPIILAGGKLDLRDDSQIIRELRERGERPVTTSEGEKVSKELKLNGYFEFSGKTQKGLKELFMHSIAVVLNPDRPLRPYVRKSSSEISLRISELREKARIFTRKIIEEKKAKKRISQLRKKEEKLSQLAEKEKKRKKMEEKRIVKQKKKEAKIRKLAELKKKERKASIKLKEALKLKKLDEKVEKKMKMIEEKESMRKKLVEETTLLCTKCGERLRKECFGIGLTTTYDSLVEGGKNLECLLCVCKKNNPLTDWKDELTQEDFMNVYKFGVCIGPGLMQDRLKMAKKLELKREKQRIAKQKTEEKERRMKELKEKKIMKKKSTAGKSSNRRKSTNLLSRLSLRSISEEDHRENSQRVLNSLIPVHREKRGGSLRITNRTNLNFVRSRAQVEEEEEEVANEGVVDKKKIGALRQVLSKGENRVNRARSSSVPQSQKKNLKKNSSLKFYRSSSSISSLENILECQTSQNIDQILSSFIDRFQDCMNNVMEISSVGVLGKGQKTESLQELLLHELKTESDRWLNRVFSVRDNLERYVRFREAVRECSKKYFFYTKLVDEIRKASKTTPLLVISVLWEERFHSKFKLNIQTLSEESSKLKQMCQEVDQWIQGSDDLNSQDSVRRSLDVFLKREISTTLETAKKEMRKSESIEGGRDCPEISRLVKNLKVVFSRVEKVIDLSQYIKKKESMEEVLRTLKQMKNYAKTRVEGLSSSIQQHVIQRKFEKGTVGDFLRTQILSCITPSSSSNFTDNEGIIERNRVYTFLGMFLEISRISQIPLQRMKDVEINKFCVLFFSFAVDEDVKLYYEPLKKRLKNNLNRKIDDDHNTPLHYSAFFENKYLIVEIRKDTDVEFDLKAKNKYGLRAGDFTDFPQNLKKYNYFDEKERKINKPKEYAGNVIIRCVSGRCLESFKYATGGYQYGNLHGLCKVMFDSGVVQFYGRFKSGKTEGYGMCFTPNGVRESFCCYQNGKKNGECVFYDKSNGQEKERKLYQNGKRLRKIKKLSFAELSFSGEEVKNLTTQPHLLSRISGGAAGSVYRVSVEDNMYAFKNFKNVVPRGSVLGGQGEGSYSFMTRHYRHIKTIMAELKVISFCEHRNVVKVYGVSRNFPVGIIMELAQNCLSALIKTGNLSLNNKMQILYDVSCGMSHMHSVGIIHRDLKPDNILIFGNVSSNEFVCKVCDFGYCVFKTSLELAKLQENDLRENVAMSYVPIQDNRIGTLNYVAPELEKNKGYDEMVDIWSFGILAHQVLMESVFPCGMKKIQKDSKLSSLHPVVRDLFRDIVVKCIDDDPTNRPSFEDVVSYISKRSGEEFILISKDHSLEENDDLYLKPSQKKQLYEARFVVLKTEEEEEEEEEVEGEDDDDDEMEAQDSDEEEDEIGL